MTWRALALCRVLVAADVNTTEDWFPTALPARGQRAPRPDASIRAVCAACPVRAECLDHALAAGERHGVWGGVNMAAWSEREQAARGRRRKAT